MLKCIHEYYSVENQKEDILNLYSDILDIKLASDIKKMMGRDFDVNIMKNPMGSRTTQKIDYILTFLRSTCTMILQKSHTQTLKDGQTRSLFDWILPCNEIYGINYFTKE